jgi:nucleotide-binding universal stress UspA family protein
MRRQLSVLCPIDFSTPARAALRYAIAVAEHCRGRLTLVTVNDPLLAEAADIQLGPHWLLEDSARELRRFFEKTMEHRSAFRLDVDYVVVGGHPAQEILKAATQQRCDLIVMSTHGLTGMRKLFFGATTERVLRESSVPVLVTPPTEPGPLYLEEFATQVRRVLVPVDLSPAAKPQIRVAAGLAGALHVPMLLMHVVEPLRYPSFAAADTLRIDAERRIRAEQALAGLRLDVSPAVMTEAITALGDPAEEISKIARERRAGLIVVGLHDSATSNARLGSVTYRVLCLSQRLVLALPPGRNQSRLSMAFGRHGATESSAAIAAVPTTATAIRTEHDHPALSSATAGSSRAPAEFSAISATRHGGDGQ